MEYVITDSEYVLPTYTSPILHPSELPYLGSSSVNSVCLLSTFIVMPSSANTFLKSSVMRVLLPLIVLQDDI